MKTATVQDLRQRFGEVEKWLEAGEEVAVTRRGIVVGTIVPPEPAPPKPAKTPPKADWARWQREHPRVKPKKPLTAEETAAFYQALKRDF